MMRAPLVMVPLLAGLAGMLAAAADPAAPSERQRINRLIDQLDSSRFAEREAASKLLQGIGAPALAALKRVAAGDEPETRRRAQELIGRIEQRLQAEKLLKATTVHLVCRGTPLVQAVADLSRKSGHAIVLSGDAARYRERTVTLDTGPTTFWQALDQLRRAAGLDEDDQAEAPLPVEQARWARRGALQALPPRIVPAEPAPIVLKEARPRERGVHYAGAARIRVLPADAAIQGTPREAGEIVFALETSLEPRVGLEQVTGVRIEKALDDLGQELRQNLESDPAAPFGEPVFIAGHSGLPRALLGAGAQQLAVRLQSGNKTSRSIKELRGWITAEVRLPPEPVLEVGEILEAAGKTVQGPRGAWVTVGDIDKLDEGQIGVRIDFQPAQGNVNGLFHVVPRGRFVAVPVVPELPQAVQAQLQQAGGAALIAPAGGVLADPMGLSLVDDKGRSFQLAGVPRRRSNVANNNVVHELTLLFKPQEGQGQPVKLVYTTMRVLTLDIPFVLKDIPLP